MDYKQKYLKYKTKYLNLLNKSGGAIVECDTTNPKSEFIYYIWTDIWKKLQKIDSRYQCQIGRLEHIPKKSYTCNLWIWMDEFESSKNQNHIDCFINDLENYEYNKDTNMIKIKCKIGISVTKNNEHNLKHYYQDKHYPEFNDYTEFINGLATWFHLIHVFHFENTKYDAEYLRMYGVAPYPSS